MTRDIIDFLKFDLKRKQKRNPSFSLRAYSNQLGIEHSTVSQWMRRKRKLTAAQLLTLVSNLKLSKRESSAYLKHFIQGSLQEKILVIAKMKQFKPRTRWIAEILDENEDDVNIALFQLLSAKKMKMIEKPEWKIKRKRNK